MLIFFNVLFDVKTYFKTKSVINLIFHVWVVSPPTVSQF